MDTSKDIRDLMKKLKEFFDYIDEENRDRTISAKRYGVNPLYLDKDLPTFYNWLLEGLEKENV